MAKHCTSSLPAPTECADPLDKDAFWSQLDLHLSGLPCGSQFVCMDANATVGSVVCDSIGPVAPAQKSDNGMSFRSVLSSHHLAAVNTFVDGSPTWTDPRIDYIAIPTVLVPAVQECRVDQDINLSPMVSADHELLRVSLSHLPSQA